MSSRGAEGVVEASEVEARAMDMAGGGGGGGGGAEVKDSEPAAIKPSFPELDAREMGGIREELRSIRVPPHRYTPLKDSWDYLSRPVTEHLKLQIRMNFKTRTVDVKTCSDTRDPGALQKAVDFIRAFMMGFDHQDCVALLRLDDLYIDSFEVTDVKMLKHEHLSRAVGRIAGMGGKTKNAIENATRTRVVLAERKVHILGAYANIQIARDAICSLIMGAPPGKVYNHMRIVSSRLGARH